MKKKISLTVVSSKQVEYDVEFPIYSKLESDPGDDTSVKYRRLDSNMLLVTIEYNQSQQGETYEIATEHNSQFPSSAVECALGLGKFACTADEFSKALGKAARFIETLK